LSMVETTVVLRPESEWPRVPRWYDDWPSPVRALVARFTPPHRTSAELEDAMNEALRIPGMPNIWTMPIKNRIDMLSTGVRPPIGIKVLGPDLAVIQNLGERLEALLRTVPGTRTVLAERTAGGYYVDVDFARDRLARYGVTIADAQAIVGAAIGGETV